MASTLDMGVQTDATVASIIAKHLAPDRRPSQSQSKTPIFDLYDDDKEDGNSKAVDEDESTETDHDTTTNEAEAPEMNHEQVSPRDNELSVTTSNDDSVTASRPMGIGDRITFAEDSFRTPTSGQNGSSGQDTVSVYDDVIEDPNDPEQDDKGLAGKITWWFAGKGIPLIAATMGPLANLTSVCAIIATWRVIAPTNGVYIDQQGIPDPRWAIAVNAASLVCGFLGNLLLMLNYAQTISYKIAMPFTILFWYLASGCLASVLIAIHVYAPPHRPEETYSQGYWYGVISACLYLFAASLLFINILGYLKGHYPAHIQSSKNERSLMLQTILFFIWLGGGGWVFSKIEGWDFTDAIYFCNVTLLTVGFGDLYATTDVGRGIVFPFSVIGIIMLGLVVNSIYGLIVELGETDVVHSYVSAQEVAIGKPWLTVR